MIEEYLGQHCQTLNTLSNSRDSLEKGEEDLHTAHTTVVRPARSQPMMNPSTALQCWICQNLVTETRTLQPGEACCLTLFPSSPPSLPELQCYSPQYLRLADLF